MTRVSDDRDATQRVRNHYGGAIYGKGPAFPNVYLFRITEAFSEMNF